MKGIALKGICIDAGFKGIVFILKMIVTLLTIQNLTVNRLLIMLLSKIVSAETIEISALLARHEGLEPPTDRFEVCDSIH